MGSEYSMREKKSELKFRWENLKEEWKNIHGDGRIILKTILNKYGIIAWTGSVSQ
jgi:hypothetical protein